MLRPPQIPTTRILYPLDHNNGHPILNSLNILGLSSGTINLMARRDPKEAASQLVVVHWMFLPMPSTLKDVIRTSLELMSRSVYIVLHTHTINIDVM